MVRWILKLANQNIRFFFKLAVFLLTLNIKELREFRENENQNNLNRRRSKKRSGKEVAKFEETLKGRIKISNE